MLTASRALADYFEAVVAACGDAEARRELGHGRACPGALNRDGLEIGATPVPAAALAGMLDKIADGTISGKIAKEVFEAMWSDEGNRRTRSSRRGLVQISDSGEIEQASPKVIAANPGQVEQYRAGKEQAVRLLRRPGDEGVGGQGESRSAE